MAAESLDEEAVSGRVWAETEELKAVKEWDGKGQVVRVAERAEKKVV